MRSLRRYIAVEVALAWSVAVAGCPAGELCPPGLRESVALGRCVPMDAGDDLLDAGDDVPDAGDDANADSERSSRRDAGRSGREGGTDGSVDAEAADAEVGAGDAEAADAEAGVPTDGKVGSTPDAKNGSERDAEGPDAQGAETGIDAQAPVEAEAGSEMDAEASVDPDAEAGAAWDAEAGTASDSAAGADAEAGGPWSAPEAGTPECSASDVAAWHAFHVSPGVVDSIGECASAPECADGLCALDECLRPAAGVEACAECVADEVACVATRCRDECKRSRGDAACLACACEQGCTGRFESCAGVELELCDACFPQILYCGGMHPWPALLVPILL